MNAVRVKACAKINLCLEVVGRRPDGYHDLATIFQAVSLHDDVEVKLRDERGIRLDVEGADVPPGRDNLAWRAAQVYRQMRKWPAGASIRLIKRIPLGAGLGGGSSDAAAVVLALREMDPAPLDVAQVERLMAALGSDVPFFLTHGTAIGYGRGDDVAGLTDLPYCWIVLVKPQLSISTVAAYRMLKRRDLTDGTHAQAMAEAIDRGAELDEIAQHVHNAFARPLTERWPLFGELKRRLMDAGALTAEITGSGSVVFGLFRAHEEAKRAAEVLEAEGLWACVVEPMPAGAEIVECVE